jgi:hypothetical protein
MKLFRYEQLQQEAKVNDSLIVRGILCKYCPHKNPQHSRLQQKFYWSDNENRIYSLCKAQPCIAYSAIKTDIPLIYFLGGIISIKMEVGVVFLGNFMSSGCWLGSFYGCRKFEKLLAK